MGGAKNCPETPRQKMIGMMYLVLTAMLALNVSAAILNGYMQVDDSLHATINSVENSNSVLYAKFNAAMNDNPDKTREWYSRAQQVKAQSDSLFNYIQYCKDELVRMSGGAVDKKTKEVIETNATVRQMKKQDDTNVPSQFGLNEGNGAILKERLIAYRTFLDNISDGVKKNELAFTFNVDDRYDDEQKENVTWENSLFHEMPVCATITMLTKIQNDIRTEENNIVMWLESQTDAGDLRVNKMNAYVIPKSDYVIEGGKYSARIIMAAIDSTQTPEYMVNGQKIGADGIYEVVARGTGSHKFSGQIVYTNPSGEKEFLPFQSEYTVGEPSVTISNTEMNIMYRGFENKFDISVPGISNDKLKVDVQGAALSRKGGLWIIKPGDNAKQVTVNVKAELDGKLQSMGSRTYRVKTLPKPSAFFVTGGVSADQGALAKKQMMASDAMIEASYGEDGILDLDFRIRTFTLRAGGKLLESKSGKLTEEQKNLIKSLRSGEDVIFNSIHAVGPDGVDRLLNTIALTVK